jgi:hypothetical protein
MEIRSYAFPDALQNHVFLITQFYIAWPNDLVTHESSPGSPDTSLKPFRSPVGRAHAGQSAVGCAESLLSRIPAVSVSMSTSVNHITSRHTFSSSTQHVMQCNHMLQGIGEIMVQLLSVGRGDAVFPG